MQQYNFWNFRQQSQKKTMKMYQSHWRNQFIIKRGYFYSTNNRVFFSETKTKSENFW